MAVILIVVSEMVGANGGIGYFVRSAERSFAIPEMWSGIIVLGLVGYALNTLFRIVEAWALDWLEPPFCPPLRDEVWLTAWPRPEPDFFPPPVSLLTVAHARRSASPLETPRFS